MCQSGSALFVFTCICALDVAEGPSRAQIQVKTNKGVRMLCRRALFIFSKTACSFCSRAARGYGGCNGLGGCQAFIPRCVQILSISLGLWIIAFTFILPLHFGHSSGSTSKILAIQLAQWRETGFRSGGVSGNCGQRVLSSSVFSVVSVVGKL